jgi:hypothetical protein
LPLRIVKVLQLLLSTIDPALSGVVMASNLIQGAQIVVRPTPLRKENLVGSGFDAVGRLIGIFECGLEREKAKRDAAFAQALRLRRSLSVKVYVAPNRRLRSMVDEAQTIGMCGGL